MRYRNRTNTDHPTQDNGKTHKREKHGGGWALMQTLTWIENKSSSYVSERFTGCNLWSIGDNIVGVIRVDVASSHTLGSYAVDLQELGKSKDAFPSISHSFWIRLRTEWCVWVHTQRKPCNLSNSSGQTPTSQREKVLSDSFSQRVCLQETWGNWVVW